MIRNLIETVKPKYAVLTVDESENRVDEKLCHVLTENDCEILYTYHGNIIATLDGTESEVVQK